MVNALYKDEAPPTVLIGHRWAEYSGIYHLNSSLLISMGGAIAVRVAAAGLVPTLVGLAVIDVVEGKCIIHCGQDGVA